MKTDSVGQSKKKEKNTLEVLFVESIHNYSLLCTANRQPFLFHLLPKLQPVSLEK